MTSTMHPRSRRHWSPLKKFIIAYVLTMMVVVGAIAILNSLPAPAPTIDEQFIPGYETSVLGMGPNVQAGIGYGDTPCSFGFSITTLDYAEFINVTADGPARDCSAAVSVDRGDGFSPWKTTSGDNPLGATVFADEAPYAVAVAYRITFNNPDGDLGDGEEIILQQEGGPDELTDPRFVDD